jgi:KDO2-lipid IV(A) lauroyltransferase
VLKKIEHLAGYSFVLLFDGFFSIWPRSWALKCGECLGLFFSCVLGSRRRLVIQNLTAAFPEKKPEEIRRIARGMWKSLGRTAIEFIRLTDIHRSNFDKYYIVEGRENLERAMKKGHGTVLATMHFTNWEMMGVATAFLTGNMVAIARPIKNPYVERWIQRKRAESGMEIILHRQAVKASLKMMREKKSLGVLVDQNLYTGGVFVDFFGRPAATTTLPALLHNRTGAPVLVVYCLREGDKFRLVYGPELDLPPIEDAEKRALAHTQIVAKEMERVIRAHPENWFWIHNRWKRKDIHAQ